MVNQSSQLQQLGYETSMVFVNTSLTTAQERNRKRARSVPPSIVEKGWNDVQRNLNKFGKYFGKNFHVADNNTGDDLTAVTKAVRRSISKKVDNPIASAWIANELKKKQMS